MIRCMKTSFRANKETIDRLFQCNRVSGEVWNRCLELAKETPSENREMDYEK